MQTCFCISKHINHMLILWMLATILNMKVHVSTCLCIVTLGHLHHLRLYGCSLDLEIVRYIHLSVCEEGHVCGGLVGSIWWPLYRNPPPSKLVLCIDPFETNLLLWLEPMSSFSLASHRVSWWLHTSVLSSPPSPPGRIGTGGDIGGTYGLTINHYMKAVCICLVEGCRA